MREEQEKLLEQIKKKLPDYESPERLSHTLGVLRECCFLAEAVALSEDDVFSLCKAALLHDITKSKTEEEQFKLCREFGILTPAEPIYPTLHQDTGAPFAKRVFGSEVVNETVYSAIACHTTGKADMNLTDKLLFVADFVEPGRKYRSCLDIREYLHSGCEKINKNDKAARVRLLDDTTKRIIGFTVTYLIEKGRKIHPDMVLAWNSLI